MRFTYSNFKEKAPMIELRDDYASVQAWALEYYKHTMQELEEMLTEKEADLKRYKELRLPGISYASASAQIGLLREILGTPTS